MNRILVTPRSLSKGGHRDLERLEERGYVLVMPSPGQTPSEAELVSAVPGCVGWLAGVEPVSDRVLDRAESLQVISRNGSGVDNLPIALLQSKGIAVRRTEGANARAVAELALTLILAGLRHVVWTHEGMRSGDWPRQMGREINGGVIGIIGLGAIGSELANLCLSLGAKVRAYDPYAPADTIEHPNISRVSVLDDALHGVDAISLHAPLPADGRPLITPDVMGQVTPGTVLVNTARAGLIDPSATLNALDTGHLACYACDVFQTEPPEPHPLLAHPRTILTSHIGGYTQAAIDRSTRLAVDNLIDALHV